MSAVLQLYDTLKRNADPRVDSWLFMSTLWPTIYISLAYLSIVYLFLPAYMKNRKPYNLAKIIKIYNLFQIGACIALIYYIAAAGWIQGKYSIGCQPIDYSNDKNAIQLLDAFHLMYFLKMIELVETMFFILRKKYNQVSGLHVYHHVSTMFLAWIGCKFIGGGMSSLPVMVNSFIHVLMYTYYYLSSLGPKWQKRLAPWKPRLTIAQMIQFTILIVHSLTSLQPSCRIPKTFLLVYLPNIVIIFKMFYDFYRTSYEKSKEKT